MQRLVFGDVQPDGRQILHLTPLAGHDRPCVQRRLAGGADGGAMLHHRIRLGHQMQRLARMPQLPAGLLAALAAQAARAGQLPLQPVGGGRFAAVVAVLRQPRLQLLGRANSTLTCRAAAAWRSAHAAARSRLPARRCDSAQRHASMLHLLRKSA